MYKSYNLMKFQNNITDILHSFLLMKIVRKIMISRLWILFFIIVGTLAVDAQTSHSLRKKGDKDYSKGSYPEAEEKYRKALEKEPDVKAHFNLGNSLFNQQRYEEAQEQYNKAIANTNDPLIQSRAYYNKGNAWFSEQKLDKSIEAYKDALRLDPGDEAAKNNLFLTRQLLKQQEQQEQQQQQENQEQQEDQDQQEQQEDQDQQDSQEQDKQEKQEEQENQQQETQEPESPDSTAIDSLMQKQITREELMKLLKAIEEEDKKIQQKLRRGSSQKKKTDKDW